jgi:NADH-quinone oxidoreductase subunit J
MLANLDQILGPVYFWLFALGALACAMGVLISRHPLFGAINLIGVMLALAGLYAVLGGPFLGVIQVLTYAGAIMMLLVFVIMVLNRAKDHDIPRFDGYGILTLVLPAILVMAVGGVLKATAMTDNPDALRGEIEPIARSMFDFTANAGGWWILFEIIGVLLLVAAVAAVILSKRELDTPVDDTAKEGDRDGAH